MTDGMMNLQEVLHYLRIPEHELQSHIRKGEIAAYKIGGVYLRFRHEQVELLREKLQRKGQRRAQTGRVEDFLRYNGFYILTALVLGGILLFVLR